MKGVACALLAGALGGYLVAWGAVSNEQLLSRAAAQTAPTQTRGERAVLVGETEVPSPERPLPGDPHDLDVAYAEVSLKLLKLDLQKMTDLQNRVRGSITASQFDRVEGLVRVATESLQLTKEGKATRGAINVLRAREALRNAEFVWKTAQQVKTAANAISDTELARLRTMVDVERLMLARAEQAAASDSALDDLAWENDQLRDELLRLRYRFEALTARR